MPIATLMVTSASMMLSAGVGKTGSGNTKRLIMKSALHIIPAEKPRETMTDIVGREAKTDHLMKFDFEDDLRDFSAPKYLRKRVAEINAGEQRSFWKRILKLK